ncbi:Chaperone protein dnaJ 49-like protein [Drosera capensis]
MECNKDEAIKAKELAEKRFQEKDMLGAKRLALKAKTLYPSLEGLPGFLGALDIYIAAESKINGEVDWYRVLGVDPSADVDTVRKNYRKLALTLHPDKNQSIGADGAFKILSQAWSLLSDKGKRMLYDQKRNPGGIHQKITRVDQLNPDGRSVVRPPTPNLTAKSRNQNTGSRLNVASPSARPPRTDTFWTACSHCKMQYEYLKHYLNHLLICPNCHESFTAIPMAPPEHLGHQSWSSYVQKQGSSHPTGTNSSARRGGDSTSSTPGAAREVDRSKQRFSSDGQAFNGNVTGRASQIGKGNGIGSAPGVSRGGGSVAVAKVNVHGLRLANGTRELSPLETRNMLIEKGKMEILRKLAAANTSGKEKKEKPRSVGLTQKTTVNSRNKPVRNGSKSDGESHGVGADDVQVNNLKVPSPTASNDSGGAKDDDEIVPQQMNVPDPDFHDFDKDWTEKSFGENQVWAAYDEDDGMPRYYAMIHSITSRRPFRMRMSWLNSKSNAEFGQSNWVACGFSKTSGDFRVGKHETYRTINSFSHRVKWKKGARGAISIYPQKGDVWALYRNWSPEWNELTPDELIHKYDMVEVVEDYSEEKGVTVAPLVKVAGFKTVFRQHSDPQKIRFIPREEIFRLSHQVPSCLLTGEESAKAPAGCRELDPAATPLELLQVISEATKQKITTNSDNVVSDNSHGIKRTQMEDSTVSDKPAKKSRTVEDDGRIEVVADVPIANGT